MHVCARTDRQVGMQMQALGQPPQEIVDKLSQEGGGGEMPSMFGGSAPTLPGGGCPMQ